MYTHPEPLAPAVECWLVSAIAAGIIALTVQRLRKQRRPPAALELLVLVYAGVAGLWDWVPDDSHLKALDLLVVAISVELARRFLLFSFADE